MDENLMLFLSKLPTDGARTRELGLGAIKNTVTGSVRANTVAEPSRVTPLIIIELK